MSARNMVRNLRDSGAFDGKPPRSGLASIVLLIAAAGIVGAIGYVGLVYALPHAAKLLEKPPVKVNYARPD